MRLTDKWRTPKNKARRMEAMRQDVPPGFCLYADGCCEPNPGVGGWGFVAYRDGAEIYFEHGGSLASTNNEMELTSAIKAAAWAGMQGEPFRLFSDSMYVVQGANNWRHDWKAKGWMRGSANAKAHNRQIANLGLWQLLDVLLVAITIKFEWCKAHVGIVGNERADELSSIGRESVLPRSDVDVRVAMLADQLNYETREIAS